MLMHMHNLYVDGWQLLPQALPLHPHCQKNSIVPPSTHTVKLTKGENNRRPMDTLMLCGASGRALFVVVRLLPADHLEKQVAQFLSKKICIILG